MGSFDGAEIWELVGISILHVLGAKYGKNNHGTYRDDGLAYFENMNGSQADRIRKDFIAIFKNEFQLKIVCNTNLKIVNFLDVTFDLTTGKYKPYNKPGNIPVYINVKSSHPPDIKENILHIFHATSINYHLIKRCLKIPKISTIMLFLTVVSNRKSNLIKILAITTAKMRTENETSHGSILPTVITF